MFYHTSCAYLQNCICEIHIKFFSFLLPQHPPFSLLKNFRKFSQSVSNRLISSSTDFAADITFHVILPKDLWILSEFSRRCSFIFTSIVFPRVLWERGVDPFEREVIYVSDRVPGCSEDLMSDVGNELRDRKVRDAQLVTRARFYANNCSSWKQRSWLWLRVWLYIYVIKRSENWNRRADGS